jgi:NADPH-dependent 2,4-dienoyl-CoA reductase/sulfur reductase-like enzyme
MSGSRLSAPHGLWIDRKTPVRFDFNGREIQGLAGDTVASALLASGVRLVGRSFKLDVVHVEFPIPALPISLLRMDLLPPAATAGPV